MSRSGYSDDCDGWALIRWRGAVQAAVRGRRGQALLHDLAAALDAMPVRELIPDELQAAGQYCALGALGAARGLDMAHINPEDREQVAKAFGCAPALAAEIMFENDDDFLDWDWVDLEICGPMRPGEKHARTMRLMVRNAAAARWRRMRAWVQRHLQPLPAAPPAPIQWPPRA